MSRLGKEIKGCLNAWLQTISLSVLFSHVAFIPYVHAGPVGGNVVGGSGSINQSGVNTTINQNTQNLAIDWQSYNVNVDERVKYIQPNVSSIALNRILSNSASQIHGRIDANGQVILVNPNGVFFSPTASINVGGLIASGLDIKPTDFMNGNYIFDEVLGTDGTVINSGIINASLGGSVALLGKQVKNEGLISAKLGTVTLAAGKQAVLTFDNGGLLGVKISKAILQDELGIDPAVLNSGDINAEGGRVLLTASVSQDIFSQAVNSNGIDQAISVVANGDGTFNLGGGADVRNSGTVDVSATAVNQNAGQIVLLGENVTSSGVIKADAANGNGGEIELHSQDTTLLTQNSVTSAQSEANGKGGIVKVLGNHVGLFDHATVDVSGANGGGQALIGGGFQGKNSAIRNATATIVGNNTNIYADAVDKGDGGKVILWSDVNTYFAGNIFTRGGALSGDGGLVETSGKQNLWFRGYTDRTAVNGISGTLLLDPRNITIQTNGNANDNTILTTNGEVVFTDFVNGNATNDDFFISVSILVSELDNGNVTLQANADINVDNAVNANSGNTSNLILQAGDDVKINAAVDLRGGDLTIVSGSAGCITTSNCNGPRTRDILIDAPVNTTGNITLNAADNVIIEEAIGGSLRPNSLTIRAGNDINVYTINGNDSNNGSITTSSNVTLTAADSSLSTGSNPITLAPDPGNSLTGNIIIEGDVTTGNGNFTATTTAGYFDNWFSNQNLNAGTGSVSITANGSGTISKFGQDITAGAFLGDITTIGTGTLSVTTATGQIVQSIGQNRNLDIAGTSTFNASDNAINLQNSFNNLQGEINLINTGANSVDLVNAAATTLLGNVSVGGALTVNADRNLSLTNDVIVGGAAQLNFGQDNSNGRIFTVSPSLSITTGSLIINGGTGNDTFNIASSIDGQLNGDAGSDTFNILASNLAFTDINGGGGNDKLVADNEDNYWYITTGTGQGDIYRLEADRPPTGAGPESLRFRNIEDLTGGSGIDDFLFAAGGDITGQIDGAGGGADKLDIQSLGSTTVQLGLSADAVGDDNLNVANIEDITALDTATNEIIGAAASNIWTVNNNSVSGTVANSISVTYRGFDDITGGTGVDTFNISANFSGTINGGIDGTGTNSDDTSADIFNFQTGLSNTTFSGTVNGRQGGDIFTITGTNITFSNAINGGAGTDELVAANEANYWDITAAEGGAIYSSGTNKTLTTLRLAFSGVENLTGNTGIDDFLITSTGSLAGAIDGGTSTGLNTLTARDLANTWTIAAAGNSLQYTLVADDPAIDTTFSNINILNGGSLVDTFNIGANFDGAINGGLATDTSGDLFNFLPGLDNLNFTGTVNGGQGNDTFTITGTNISFTNTINGGAGTSDTLVAADEANFWDVNVANGGGIYRTVADRTSATNPRLRFSGIENLTGNNSVDSFLMGASGSITNIDGVSATGNTLIARSGVTNKWNFTSPTENSLEQTSDPATIYVANFINIQTYDNTGGTGSVWADFSGSTGTVDVNAASYFGFTGIIGNSALGSGTISTLRGQNGSINNWQIENVANVTPPAGAGLLDGVNDGTFSIGNSSLTFVDFSNLVGGSGADNFTFVGAASIGLIDGNGGTNQITGPNSLTVINNWLISNVGIGLVNGYNFTDIQTLTGGTGDDTFTFDFDPIASNITIDGRGQTLTGQDIVKLGTALSVGVTLVADYTGIERYEGNQNSNTLQGAEIPTNNWSITGVNSGTINGDTFVNFQALLGGAGNSNDNFIFVGNGSIAGIAATSTPGIDGNGGTNRVTGSEGGLNAWIISAANDGSINGNTFIDIQTLWGGDTVDDTFTFNLDPSQSGITIDGRGQTQTGQDIVALEASLSGVTLVAGSFTGIERYVGNTNPNTLQGASGASTTNNWTINGENDGMVNGIQFFDFQNLLGGTNDSIDIFTITENGSLTGLINGSGGADKFTVNELGSAATISGGTGNDEFIIDDGGTVTTLNGGDGDDIFTLNGTVVTANGDNGDDDFTVGVNGIVDFIYGGDIDTDTGTADSVTYQPGAVVELGDAIGIDGVSIDGIEVIESVGGTLYARDGVNAITQWLIDGPDSGSVTNGTDNLSFIGFSTLYGAEEDTNGEFGIDVFTITENALNPLNVTSGSVSGLISGRSGDDRLEIDLPTTLAQISQINFDGGGENDVVTINGVAVNNETYNPGIGLTFDDVPNNYDQLVYGTGLTFTVNYRQVATVNDNIQATTLTINGTGNSETIEFGTDISDADIFTVGAATSVNYSNKDSLIVTGLGGSDTIDITDSININGLLTLTAETVIDSTNTTTTAIIAGGLMLDSVNSAGTDTQRISTDVTSLSINNLSNSGSIYIDETDGLNIAQMSNVTGIVDILAGGTVSNSSVLASSSEFIINTSVGNINLDQAGQNLLTGGISLFAAADVFLDNSVTTINAITAQNLTINSTGDITGVGSISVTGNGTTPGNATISSSGGNISLTSLSVAGNVTLTSALATTIDSLSAQNLTINSTSDITGVGLISVTGNGTTTGGATLSSSGGNILLTSLSADGDVYLTSALATTIDSLSAQNLTINSTGDILGAGAVLVTGNTNLSSTTGDISLTGANNFANVTVSSVNDLTLNDINALNLVSVTNATGIVKTTSNSLTVGSVTASTIDLKAITGSIVSSAGTTLTAGAVRLHAETGIGALQTQTAYLDVVNNASSNGGGTVEITNTGRVTVTNLENRGIGGIIFNNTQGDVYIDTIDADYGNGQLDMVVSNGGNVFGVNNSVFGVSGGDSFFDETIPDIIANIAYITVTDGNFGTALRPIVLNIQEFLFIESNVSSLSFLNFKEPTEGYINNSDIQISIFDSIANLSGQQLIEVESLAEIDPAIFTEVRNYYQDDIALKLPRDQLYDEDIKKQKEREQ